MYAPDYNHRWAADVAGGLQLASEVPLDWRDARRCAEDRTAPLLLFYNCLQLSPACCCPRRKERHLNGTVLEAAFQRPALLITGALNAQQLAPDRWAGAGLCCRALVRLLFGVASCSPKVVLIAMFSWHQNSWTGANECTVCHFECCQPQAQPRAGAAGCQLRSRLDSLISDHFYTAFCQPQAQPRARAAGCCDGHAAWRWQRADAYRHRYGGLGSTCSAHTCRPSSLQPALHGQLACLPACHLPFCLAACPAAVRLPLPAGLPFFRAAGRQLELVLPLQRPSSC